MRLPIDVLADAVDDRLVVGQGAVSRVLVSVDRRLAGGPLLDERHEGSNVGGRHDGGADAARSAVLDARYRGLACGAAALVEALVRVLVPLLAADVGLVCLDWASERGLLVTPRLADTVRQVPR